MALKINLGSNINNASLQIGDTAYHVSSNFNYMGYNWDNDKGEYVIDDSTASVISSGEAIKKIGEITSIGGNNIIIETPFSTPSEGDFIMFSKDKSANNTSLLGYYAEVKLNNNSTEKAELFTLGSEIAPSSK